MQQAPSPALIVPRESRFADRYNEVEFRYTRRCCTRSNLTQEVPVDPTWTDTITSSQNSHNKIALQMGILVLCIIAPRKKALAWGASTRAMHHSLTKKALIGVHPVRTIYLPPLLLFALLVPQPTEQPRLASLVGLLASGSTAVALSHNLFRRPERCWPSTHPVRP